MGESKGVDPPLPRMWEADGEASITSHTGAGISRGRVLKRPALMVMEGSSAGRIFPIQSEKLTVGRSKQAGFSIEDEGISRMHCGVSFSEGAYVLSDLGSTNGTRVNGDLVDRVPLRPGDRIQLGPATVLQFDFYDEADGGLVQKIYEAATRDLLTGALSGRAFDERLTAEVAYAVRHKAKLVAIAVEVDALEGVAQQYGHSSSDLVLSEVASAIASTLRGEDLFARVSRSTFIVLVRGVALRRGTNLADRIQKLVAERPFAKNGIPFSVTVSYGVAELGETGVSGAGPQLVALASERITREA